MGYCAGMPGYGMVRYGEVGYCALWRYGGLGMVRYAWVWWVRYGEVLCRYGGVWWVRYGEVCRGMDSHWAVTLRH